MRVTDEYFSNLSHHSSSAAADTPAAQKFSDQPPAVLAPGSPPLHTSESGHPLETLKERAEKAKESADRLLEVVERHASWGWKEKGHLMRPVYSQELRKWKRERLRAANLEIAVREMEDHVEPSREPGPRLTFHPSCRDNDGGLHDLHQENQQGRYKRRYDRRAQIYCPGRWAASPGHEAINTSWFRVKTPPWVLEWKEAKERKQEEEMKQPDKPSDSSVPADSPPPPSTPAHALASPGSPKRRREDDDDNDRRPSSPKRPRLVPGLPVSLPLPAPAASPSRLAVSPPLPRLRAASVPPPSPCPWVIGRQKRRRDDNDDDEGAAQGPDKPKRIRLSPQTKRASSAPPGPVVSSSDKSSITSQAPATSLIPQALSSSACPSAPSPSSSLSGSSSSSPSASLPTTNRSPPIRREYNLRSRGSPPSHDNSSSSSSRQPGHRTQSHRCHQ
ncbi:hypothetical protein JOL62DRAFT_627008 [Phyllosticta paracitricarpa]|uniref:Uncharacterized protein n=1 Tax=Phyllosticta paracitricarpa TaxID=2016321 RepID=A0ABR1MY88_9PEZI